MGLKSFIAAILIVGVLGIAVYSIVSQDLQKVVSEEDSVLATVNGKTITVSDIKRAQQTVNLTSGELIDNARALEKVINEKLILEQADKLGLSYTTEEAENNLEKISFSKGKTLDDLKKSLEQKGANYTQEVEIYRQQMTIARVLKQEIKIPQVTDAETLVYYNENKDTMFTNKQVSYEQISSQLKEALTKKEYDNYIVNYISDLRKNAEIVYLTEDRVPTYMNSTNQTTE